MRILHIGKYFPPFAGGMENFLADLLDESSNQLLQCAALVHDHSNGKLAEKEIIDGNEIVRVRTHGQLLFAPVSPAFPGKLKQMLESFEPDVIDIHMPNTSAFFLLFSSASRRIPWVIHWHSDVVFPENKPLLKLAYWLYRPLEYLMLRKSKAVITTSPNYLKTSATLKPFLDKCSVIPLTINESRIPTLSHTMHEKARNLWNTGTTGDQPFRVLCVGRLTHYKGHELLIEAIAKINPETANISTLIVGEGELESSLQQQIVDARLTSRIKLLGHQSDLILNALLANCDVLCMPSTLRTEAFGLVLLEAMYHGKPALVSDIEGSGMTWVIRDNQNGWYSPVGDPDALAKKLVELQQNPQLIMDAGQRSREIFDAEYSANQCVKQTIQIYEQSRQNE
ncbi:MAG: glycosyltransferase [Gammaproteobacteria bacterium]|nr:glycosyltransferase [Gammaproteobacteria bacterium]